MSSTNIILALNHNGGSKLFAIDVSSSYSEIQSQVFSNWPNLRNKFISFKFSVGEVSNCTLANDTDLMNLVSLCDFLSKKVVQVHICFINNTPHSDMHCDPSAHEHAYVHVSGNEQAYVHVSSRCDSEFDAEGDTVDDEDLDSNRKRKSGVNKFNKMPFKHAQERVIFGNDSVLEDGVGAMPSYDVCPNVMKKPLLSDHWAHIMDKGIGTVFKGGATEFRSELIKYSTQMGFRFRYKKNNKRYINVVCTEFVSCECAWSIHAKLHNSTGSFIISKAHLAHSCIGKLLGVNNRRFGPKIIGEELLHDVREKPSTCGRDIINKLKLSYGLDIPYWKAHRTHGAAMKQIFGSYDDSYDQLRWYCDAVLRTNKGSIVSLQSNPRSQAFERIFIAFKACLDGFQKCRPMLFVDGTFMTGRAKGTLLIATAKDGNNGLFPVAYAVVSAENTDNWRWFLEKLRDHVHHEREICYIFYRNTGLMAAFPLVFEKPVHYFCLYHLLGNLRGRFSKGYSNDQRENIGVLFKRCAYAPNMRIFKEMLDIFLGVGGKKAEEWIADLPFEKWAVAYAPHIKYGEYTSNAAEQFNSWIKDARSLPITHMVDQIRSGISNWIVDRRKKCSTWTGALCPMREDMWNFLKGMSRSWMVVQCPSGNYEVKSYPSAEVNLRDHMCSCYKWQVTGFPCAHAVAVIDKHCPSVYTNIEEYFFTRNYRECYSYDIHAIPETEKYEFQPDDRNKIKILPPVLKTNPGRPRKKRKPSFGEFTKKKPSVVCSRCGTLANHDPITCLLAPDDAYAGLPP